MKAKYILLAFLTLSLFSCDDNSGSLGLEMFPGGDQNVNGKLTTFDVTTQSEIAGNVFAKTSVGYLGRFTDPEFGFYEASFLSQLHCIEDFSFPAVCDPENEADRNNPKAIMVANKIHSVELRLGYSSYFGDSLAPQSMNVYQLNKRLDKQAAYYTDIDPSQFYSTSDLIGQKAYSAVNLEYNDSIRNSSNYFKGVAVKIPTEIGQKILEKSREYELNNKDFAPVFMDMFKGIYVKNSYGEGTILYIDQIELMLSYEVYVRNSKTGEIYKKHDEKTDSTGYSYRMFAATKEIIQANAFKSDETLINEKVAETQWTYLKSPAGIYTQATLPLERFEKELSNDTLNVVNLTFTNYNQFSNNNAFAMTAPNNVLLVREKDKESFFIKNKINDNITSYVAKHNYINNNQYVFSNLSQLINLSLSEKAAAIEQLATFGEISDVLDSQGQPVKTIEAWKEATQWDKVAILPVSVVSDSNGNTVAILNDLKPGYAKLKGGPTGSKLDLQITYTSFVK